MTKASETPERYLARVGDPGNRASLGELIAERGRSGKSPQTLLWDARVLADLAGHLGAKPFRGASPKELRAWDDGLRERLSPRTVATYRTVARHAYKFFSDPEGYASTPPKKRDRLPIPGVVAWMDCSRPRKELPAEEVLTEGDVFALIKAARSLNRKALIAMLYESGGRVSEVMSIGIRHLVFEDDGTVTMRITKSKTQARSVPLIYAGPYVRDWLNEHPERENPDAAFFLNDRGGPENGDNVRKWLPRHARRAGVKKPVNPHAFRVARVTNLADVLNPFEANQIFGWSKDSRMYAHYARLSGQEGAQRIKEFHGIIEARKPAESPLASVPCPRCKHLSPPGSQVCTKCHGALSVSVAMRHQEERLSMALADRGAVARVLMESATPDLLEQLADAVVQRAVEKARASTTAGLAERAHA